MAKVLYLSYDGLTDPLGPSQVLAYLVELAKAGHQITLVTFEKPERPSAERQALAEQCRATGIDWHPQRYTRRPPIISTLKDLRVMTKVAERLAAGRGFDIVHCRSYLPALVGARLKRKAGLAFLFDMRGFWADERVEGGLWNLGNPIFRTIFRWFKRQEKRLLAEADHVVVLTEAGRDILRHQWRVSTATPITVIPCCADFAAFPAITPAARKEARARLHIASQAPVAAYVGSIGTWYMLGEMLDFFALQRARNPSSVFLFVTRDATGPVLAEAARRDIPASALRIKGGTRDEVPRLLAAADYGLFFIRPTFSKQASSPVKLGELLAMELPVVTNAGVGDVDRILGETGAGISIEALGPGGYEQALDAVAALRPDRERLRAGRTRWFDLAEGVRRYEAIYEATSRNSSIKRGA